MAQAQAELQMAPTWAALLHNALLLLLAPLLLLPLLLQLLLLLVVLLLLLLLLLALPSMAQSNCLRQLWRQLPLGSKCKLCEKGAISLGSNAEQLGPYQALRMHPGQPEMPKSA